MCKMNEDYPMSTNARIRQHFENYTVQELAMVQAKHRDTLRTKREECDELWHSLVIIDHLIKEKSNEET